MRSWQNQVQVVLVEPSDSRNVGSVARAMSNLGFNRLALVKPRSFDPEQAAITACWGEPILKEIEVFEDLPVALSEFEDVVGFSARTGKNRPSPVLLPAWAQTLSAKPLRNTALVFGPEDTGLRQEHVGYCRELIRIPSVADNPAFNLAQAALLALYEMHRSLEDPAAALPTSALATWNDLEALESIVKESLNRAGFIRKATPPAMEGIVKNLLRRLTLTKREYRIVAGVFGKINKALALGRNYPTTIE